jgi:hypothetical protein
MQKKGFQVLIKTAFIIPLLILALWLIHLIYFPELDAMIEAKVKKTHEETTIFRKILTQGDTDYRGHFHMIDEYVSLSEPFKPICMTCHGTYPHSKEQKVRSILNSHSGYMACAVCHVRREAGNKDYFFVWVDRNTGMISSSVKGEFGKYPAKIFPMIIGDDGQKKIFNPVSEKAAEEYLKFKDSYTLDQNAQAKIILHEKISKKPILCNECHKKDGFFKFAELGFPANRIDHLSSTEVTGMIDRYETFYLPSVIDFGAGKTK